MKVPHSAGVVGCLVECKGCSWESSSYKNGLAIAARHAQATGHTVVAEQTIVVTYNP